MRKSKRTYVLLIAVVVIWGLLGVKLVKTLGPSQSEPMPVAQDTFVLPQQDTTTYTFTVDGNYRDPFLGTFPKGQLPKTQKSKKVTPKAPKKQLVYRGSVAGDDNTARLFFLSIDGQQHILEKGKAVQGVTLVWGNTKTVKVRYGGYTEIVKLAR